MFAVTHHFTERRFELGNDWVYEHFITMEKLRSDGLLEGDALHVRVDLTIHGTPKSSLCSQLSEAPSTTDLKSAYSFDPLLGASDLSDIKFQCDSETFLVHKAILAGQSAVFKVMLTSSLLRCQRSNQE